MGDNRMTENQAWEAMAKGKKVRRPTWKEGYYMILRGHVEHTYNDRGECVALGFRHFNVGEERTDWEVME